MLSVCDLLVFFTDVEHIKWFWEQNLENRQCLSMRHSLSFGAMILFLKGYAAGLFKMFCKDKNGIFTSTQILKSFYALGHSILDIFKVKH